MNKTPIESKFDQIKNEKLKKIKNTRITPEFLRTPKAHKAIKEGADDAFRISSDND